MRWGKWGGGKITIENDYGTSVFENVSYYAGIIINHGAQYATFGKATGIFLNSDATLQIAMPDYPGIAAGEDWVWEQTIEGNGLLVFSLPPRVAIESEPTEGDAVVDGPSIEYTPDLGSEGDDEFSYSVMTQLGDSDEALVSVSTIDLDVHDNYGNLLSEIVEDSPGANVFINTDDDNENQVPDVLESGFYDDDLVRLEIKDLGMQSVESSGVFSLDFDPLVVSIWRSSDKASDDPLLAAHVEPNEVLTSDRVFWIEGIAIGATQIVLSWTASQGVASTVFDAVLVNVLAQPNNVNTISPDPEELSVWENYIGNSAAFTSGENWHKVDPSIEGRLWNHNHHAWRISFKPSPNFSQIQKYDIWALPFSSRNTALENAEFADDPGILFQNMNGHRFVDGVPPPSSNSIFQQEPVQQGTNYVFFSGEPEELGDFVYVAVVRIADPAVRFRTSKAIAMPYSRATVEYTKDLLPAPSIVYTNPNYHPKGTHETNQWHVHPGDVIFPERNSHEKNGPTFNQLGVRVTVIPKVSRPLIAPLFMQVFDPDNKLEGAFDKNDTASSPTKEDDNFKGNPDHGMSVEQIMGADLRQNILSITGSVQLEIKLTGATPSSEYEEKVHRILNIEEGQPGNNWQVGLHDERSIVSGYNYENTPLISGNGMNLRAKGAFPDFVPDNLKTNILTAIRTLWVESDRMATPAPAGPADVERGVFDGENGCVGCDDPINFNTQTDISVLQPFVKQYLVDVKFIQNANPRTETSFIHNVLEPEKINQKGKDIRDVKSDESHWVVQVVHAYETQLEKDNDPNYQPQTIEHWSNWNNTWTLGYATGIGVDE
jgi:hypothetical protein